MFFVCLLKCFHKSFIVNLGKNYKDKTGQLKKIEATIKNLHQASEQNKSKIDDLYQIVSSAHKEILIRNANIKQLEVECNRLTKDIQKYERESSANNRKITELHSASEAKLADIQRIYEIASETGLSGEFEKRRNTLNLEITKWEKYIFWTSILLFLGIIFRNFGFLYFRFVFSRPSLWNLLISSNFFLFSWISLSDLVISSLRNSVISIHLGLEFFSCNLALLEYLRPSLTI